MCDCEVGRKEDLDPKSVPCSNFEARLIRRRESSTASCLPGTVQTVGLGGKRKDKVNSRRTDVCRAPCSLRVISFHTDFSRVNESLLTTKPRCLLSQMFEKLVLVLIKQSMSPSSEKSNRDGK